MRTFLFASLGLGLLAACGPTIPDSGAGVGFDNSVEAQRARETALTTGAAIPPPSVISEEPLGATQPSIELQQSLAGQPGTSANPGAPLSATSTTFGTATPAAPGGDIAADTAAALSATQANSGVTPIEASPLNPPPTPVNTSAISDENDFNAVSNRQSIESDAQRIQQTASERQVVAPTALPERTASGPNIVSYALATSHPRGSRIYSRTGINLTQKSLRACAKYPSPDQAQIAFLEAGGPQKDRLHLDPDGDGYACDWDPAPFRSAVQG